MSAVVFPSGHAERNNPIAIMKIMCPSLGLEEDASAQIIGVIVPQLSDKEDPS